MADVSVNVLLPAALEQYVQKRAAEVGHDSSGDYIRALIREDQKRQAREALDHLLLEGLDSQSDAVTADYLAELRREAEDIARWRKRA